MYLCECVCTYVAALVLSLPLPPQKKDRSYENPVFKTDNIIGALTDVETETQNATCSASPLWAAHPRASRKTGFKNTNLSNISKTNPLTATGSLCSMILLSVYSKFQVVWSVFFGRNES